MKWGISVLAAGALLFLSLAAADGEVWEEDDREVLVRSERGAKSRNVQCRYDKGTWSECDTKTNTRTRTLTLKKGTTATCEMTKTIEKRCKKACRYNKGNWGECADGRMSRTDSLRVGSDASCEQARQITKNCKSNKPQKKGKVSRTPSVMTRRFVAFNPVATKRLSRNRKTYHSKGTRRSKQ